MKKNLRCLLAMLAFLLLFSAVDAGQLRVQAASKKKVTTGWVKKNGKKYYYVKGKKATGWKTIKGKKYYFGKSGKKKGQATIGWKTISKKKYYFKKSGIMKTGWLTLDGKKYYFDKNGVMQKGWKNIGKKTYFFNKKTGVMNPAKTKKRKLSALEQLCEKIVNQKVKSSDSNNTKLNKLFQYVTWNCGYTRTYGCSASLGWARDRAYSMLKSKNGNCYSYACAFGFLAKKATGLSVRVGFGSTPARGGGLTPHGWCEIKIGGSWYVFDPDYYRYVQPGDCYYKPLGSCGGYYYNRKYVTLKF